MAFNQTSRPGLKKQIQGAKSAPTGNYPSAKVKGPDATSFSSRASGAGGTNGGKTGKGAQYDVANVAFSHSYNEGAAKGIVNSLHKK